MNLQYSEPVVSVTVDCVIFGFKDNKLHLLTIKRSSDPEAGKWALPGGFLEVDETVEDAADRILQIMTGVKGVYLEQVKVFSELNRHPKGRVITIGFFALVNPKNFQLAPSTYASEAEWIEVDKKPKLAFDHEEIFGAALNKLKREIKLRPIGFELLPSKFTLTDLQNLYEVIVKMKLDRRNFRRKIHSMNFLTKLDEKKRGAHKEADLYKFDKKKYKALQQEGFTFNIQGVGASNTQ